jgi:urease accessory protein
VEVFTTLLESDSTLAPTLTLTLDHDQRRRTRLRVALPDGSAVGIALPRGRALRNGDRLRSEPSGVVAQVRAKPEHVSVVETSDAHLLTRAAYHLGNRHVVLRIEPGRLCYPRDHVLDAMCRELGLRVSEQILPFEPEAGGYSGEHAHGLSLAAAALTRDVR